MISDVLPEGWSGGKQVGAFVRICGLILVGVGVFWIKSSEFENPVSITTDSASDSANQTHQAWADIEGEVQRPGLYKIGKDSRVGEVIDMAGGLTGTADRLWVEKNVNKAQIVTDGYKLYIPKLNTPDNNLSEKISESDYIGINSASGSELESLPGIGPVTAGKIISGRPYSKLEELVDRKVVGVKLFESIKGQISLW